MHQFRLGLGEGSCSTGMMRRKDETSAHLAERLEQESKQSSMFSQRVRLNSLAMTLSQTKSSAHQGFRSFEKGKGAKGRCGGATDADFNV